jgi:ankyrin repeat protein
MKRFFTLSVLILGACAQGTGRPSKSMAAVASSPVSEGSTPDTSSTAARICPSLQISSAAPGTNPAASGVAGAVLAGSIAAEVTFDENVRRVALLPDGTRYRVLRSAPPKDSNDKSAKMEIIREGTNGKALFRTPILGRAQIAELVADGSGVFLFGSFLDTLRVANVTLKVTKGESEYAHPDLFVIKLNPQGKVAWAKRFGDARYESAGGAVLDGQGTLFLTGRYIRSFQFGEHRLVSNAGSDIFVAALDREGKPLWAEPFWARGGLESFGSAIAIDRGGDVVVTGSAQGRTPLGFKQAEPIGRGDLFLARFSRDGSRLPALRFGGEGEAAGHSLIVLEDGSIVAAGTFDGVLTIGENTLRSAGRTDVWVAGFDADFTPRFAHSFGGTGFDGLARVHALSEGRVLLIASIDGALSKPVASAPLGKKDLLLTTLGSDGAIHGLETFGTSSDDRAAESYVVGDQLILIGDFHGTLTAGQRTLPSANTGTTRQLSLPLLPSTRAPGFKIVRYEDESARAAEEGDLAKLRPLVPARVSANVRVGRYGALLSSASAAGRLDAVCYLLAAGAEVNGPAHTQASPLELAAGEGHHEVVRALVEAEAAIDHAAGRTTALSAAIAGRHVEVVEYLLKHGAQVQGATKATRGPLQLAIQTQDAHLVRILLDAGADPNEQNGDGTPVLLWAAMQRSPSLVTLLIERGAKADVANLDGHTPLYAAAHAGNDAVVRALLSHGAHADPVETRYGSSALMMAANGDHVAVVRALLKAGADANRVSKDGLAVIHYAARNGAQAALRALIESGARLDARDEQGRTPRELAERTGHPKAASMLAEAE